MISHTDFDQLSFSSNTILEKDKNFLFYFWKWIPEILLTTQNIVFIVYKALASTVNIFILLENHFSIEQQQIRAMSAQIKLFGWNEEANFEYVITVGQISF